MGRIACLLLIATAATADARMVQVPTPATLSGTYESTYGEVRLTQRGDRIHGEYPCCGGGTLDGRVIEGTVVRFHWREPRGAGEGEGIWRLRNGKLEGSWGRGQSDTDGGTWNLWRSRQIAQ